MSRQVGNCSICKQVGVITSQWPGLFATLDIVKPVASPRVKSSPVHIEADGKQEVKSTCWTEQWGKKTIGQTMTKK